MTARSKKAALETAPKKMPTGVKLFALKPRVSEKAYALSEQGNTYIFDVPGGANKFDISKAVTFQYEVTVTGVRMAGVPGKQLRTYRRRGRKFVQGQRSDIRKAYVTLKDGDKLPIFAAVEETKTPEKETK
jgi:large subunit ribosomal protein L23